MDAKTTSVVSSVAKAAGTAQDYIVIATFVWSVASIAKLGWDLIPQNKIEADQETPSES